MEIEVTPEEPDEVTRAIAALAFDDPPAPDPWWQAGIEEALGE